MTAGLELCATETGNGPLLLMLHGIGGSRTAWYRQIARLEATFTCLAPDLPGYGESSDPAEPGLEPIVDALIELLAGRSAHVMGVSFGALCALGLTRRRPDLVHSLVLADATLGRANDPEVTRREWLALRSRLANDIAEASRDRAAKIAAPGAESDIVEEIAVHMRRARPAGYRNVAETIAMTDARSWLPAIVQPSLILCGVEDSVTGAAVSKELVERLPNARLTMIALAGHAPHIEQPDVFANAVMAFLQDTVAN